MTSSRKTIKWTKNGFIEHLSDFDKRMKDRALAFIIGAGASRPSGIKTGGDLVGQWLNELHRREDFNSLSLAEWATADNLGIKDFDYARAAEFYPEIFQRRFAHDREEGFAFLEETMEGKEPSLGYSILAEILSHTRHKVVVTTNFDNLVGDALAIHAREHPLICGHESLAGFIRPNMRRPLVAKIHRDLFFAPKNDTEGVSCLEEGWSDALKRLFGYYTPIVIGYGGNDGSLMGFLEKADLRGGLWWCYRAADGEPSEKIQSLVTKKQGHLVPIIGFDEFMLELGVKLISNFDIAEVGSRIETLGKDRARRYREEAEKLQKRIDGAANEDNVDLKTVRQAFLSTTDHPKDWWGWELKAQAESDPIKQEAIYREGLSHCGDSPELIGNFALFMASIRKNYVEAERLYRKALELDPNNTNNIGNFASFMTDIRKNYDETERLHRKALELDPNHAIFTGNFALFMASILKNYDEAERLYRKALELDPNLANTIGNFASFMRTIRKDYDEAERLYRKALELDPNHTVHTGNYASFTADIRKDHDKAEQLYRKALELDPNHAIATENFASFMRNIRKDYEEAERLYRKALELDPNHANITGNFASFMTDIRKDYDEAERLYRKALELDPNHANNTGNFGGFLLIAGYWDEAAKLCRHALEIIGDEVTQTAAEALLYLALIAVQQGGNAIQELTRLKQMIQKGFNRENWSFDRHLEAMIPYLDAHQLEFYRALADAILDESKVAELEKFSEWQELS